MRIHHLAVYQVESPALDLPRERVEPDLDVTLPLNMLSPKKQRADCETAVESARPKVRSVQTSTECA